MDDHKLKEIRHYTANSIYKTQRKTDELFKEYENYTKLKKDLEKVEVQANAMENAAGAKKSLGEIDVQKERTRKALRHT